MTTRTRTLKRGDIRRCIDSRSYKRGKEYFDANKVKNLQAVDTEDGFTDINSIVKGSGNNIYAQEITIEWDSWNEDGIDINGECSCPVGFNCKHIAAACLQYISEYGTEDSIPAEKDPACISWLASLVSDTLSLETTHEEFITYRLKNSRDKGILEVDLHVSRLLKKGGFGKGRRVRLHNISEHYSQANYIQPVDREIGKLLRVNNPYWDDTSIHGELGFLALGKMLKTARCFWMDSAIPLQTGEDRDLHLHWVNDKNGDARLNVKIEPAATLLTTEPLLYLDVDSQCIGPLPNAVHSAAQIEKLLRAPVIPANLAQEFSERLTQTLPTAILPPPVTIDIREISGQKTVPCLLLSATQREDHTYHLLRLRFRYKDVEIQALPMEETSSLRINKQLVRIFRDHVAEHAAVEKLQVLGFELMASENQKDIVGLSLGDRSITEGATRWQHFLNNAVPELREKGWQIEIDDSFRLQFHEASNWDVEIDEENQNDWFSLRFDITVNGKSTPLLPLVVNALEHYNPEQLPEILCLPLGDSEYLNIPAEKIKPVLNILYELYDTPSLDSDGRLKMSRFDSARLIDLDDSLDDLHWRGGDAMRKLGHQLKNFSGITEVAAPTGLKATLRDYQQQGLNWLQFLGEYNFGGVLADDMGLGKTLQTLSHLLLEKEQGRMDKPCLIIAPTSLMSNWRRETETFAPALKVLVLHGPDRHEGFEQIDSHDIVLSTYPLLSRDGDILLNHDYHTLVLDESQVIKNPRTRAAQVVRQVKTRQRLCLTGTPMENHLGELWAVFDFLMPGFLGNSRQFNRLFRNPIEKNGDAERRSQLVQRIAPFMLRRTKTEVAKELPAKTEIIRSVAMDTKQTALYESVRLSMEKKVRDAIATKGLARSHITILDALLKLRQVCCDPRLLSLKQAARVKESAKLDLLMQMLPEMIEEGRRILLFSQFTKMLGLIETALTQQGISYAKLTGQTRNRDAAIEQFKSGESPVFLISLKAGGVGLNLTEADTIIHYDPWWNPAAENQATDRAHRIGQDKAVFVYKLITENSVEEKIIDMQLRKQALADSIYQQKESNEEMKLNVEDMQALFAPL